MDSENAASFQLKIFWKIRFSIHSVLVRNHFLFLSTEFFHHFIEKDKKIKTLSYILLNLFICLTSLESIRRTILGCEPDPKTVFSYNGSNYRIPILWGRNGFMPFLWMQSECKLLQPEFELYLLILFSWILHPHVLTVIFPVPEI